MKNRWCSKNIVSDIPENSTGVLATTRMLHVAVFTTIYLLILIILTVSTPNQRNIFEKSHIVQMDIQKNVDALNFNLNAEHLTEAPYLHFTKTPREVEIVAGNEFMLKCEAVGIPPPVIEWTHNGNVIYAVDESNAAEKLHNAGLITIQYGVTASKMIIPCIGAKNTTEYKCLASNGHQKLESTTTVVVEENAKCSQNYSLPTINMWTDGRFERSGATVQLFCRVNGTPQPNVTWYNEENYKLNDIKKYNILSNGDLIIHDTEWEDLGVYICIASNEYGQDRIMAFFYPTELVY
ncbi:Zwei Ig domain protein [Dirofilaria immitis]